MGLTVEQLEEQAKSADEKAASMHSAKKSVENPVNEFTEMVKSDDYDGVGFKTKEIRRHIQDKLRDASKESTDQPGAWMKDEGYFIGNASEEIEADGTGKLPDNDVERYIESELHSSDNVTTATKDGETYFVRDKEKEEYT